MSITTYVTGWLTKKTLSTLAWIVIPLFLVVQCNRGCGSEPQIADSNAFDYTAIAVSLSRTDTTELDTTAAAEDLQKLIPAEMIEFAKVNNVAFARFLISKYVVSNGYVEKIDSTE